MADIVVDASVVAKWYLPERHHELARALRDGYLDGRHTLRAPALLPFEVVNALKYSGHYTGDRLVEASRTLPQYGIELRPYHQSGSVAEVAVELDIPLYDASYLALAETTDATVYTADSELIQATDGTAYSERTSHISDYTDR